MAAVIAQKYQTFWPRFWAGLIDALLFFPLGWLNRAIWASTTDPTLLSLWWVTYSLSMVAYYIVLHGLYGQTIGKRLMGIKVLDVSESKLSIRQAVLRDSVPLAVNVVGLASDLPSVMNGQYPYAAGISTFDWVLIYASLIWGLLELITMLFSNKRRAVHDFIAGSVVVRLGAMAEKSNEQPLRA